MKINHLAALIQNLSFVRLYRHESGLPKNNAQINLEGRSHFATEEALKYFGARISSAHEKSEGLLFYIVESSFLNSEKTKRGFRFHVFDVFGIRVLDQPMENAFKTSDQAYKAMNEAIESFDLENHYLKALSDIERQTQRKLEETQNAISQLTKEEALA
jgi:hypothetical protein